MLKNIIMQSIKCLDETNLSSMLNDWHNESHIA